MATVKGGGRTVELPEVGFGGQMPNGLAPTNARVKRKELSIARTISAARAESDLDN